MSKARKIKEVAREAHHVVEFGRYSEDSYFMIEGSQVTLVKNGYALDMAKANTTIEQGRLHFINPERLIHVVQDKV